MPKCRVILEVGTHSPWVSRYLMRQGHEVLVANPRNVALITRSRRKSDRIDAEKLARLGRADPKLLSPIQRRSEEAHLDLLEIRNRALLRLAPLGLDGTRPPGGQILRGGNDRLCRLLKRFAMTDKKHEPLNQLSH